MNLGRAKLILIVAFTGLNIFLGYHLYWPDVGKLAPAGVTAPAEQRAAEEFLNENSYYLDTILDRTARSADFLTVSTDRSLRLELLTNYTEEVTLPLESIETLYFRGDNGILAAHRNGLIQLKFEPALNPGFENMEPSDLELRSAVERLLTEMDLLPSVARFDSIQSTIDHGYIINYFQIYDNQNLFAGNLKVYIEEYLVTGVDIYWLSPVSKEVDRQLEVISAAEALIGLVGSIGPSPVQLGIDSVQFGFYSGEYDAEKWEIPPVWRIILNDGRLYYVNAFTATVEQEAVISERLE